MRKTKKLVICLCLSALMTILCAAALMTELALPAEALTSSDVVYYGNYPQTSPDFKEDPILWRVLEASGDKTALMLSEKIIDGGVAFNPDSDRSDHYATWWSESQIRKFLNGEEYVKSVSADKTMIEVDNPKDYTFYEKAFSAGEGSGIIKAVVDNSVRFRYHEVFEAGPETTDKIFLLSYADVDCSNKAQALGEKYGFGGYDGRRAEVTDYGVLQGVSGTDEDDNKTYGGWWLRSSGNTTTWASIVYSDNDLGNSPVDRTSLGIRPAFRLNLKSLLFTSPAVGGKKAGVNTILKKQEYDDSGYIHTPSNKNFTEHKLTLATKTYKLTSVKLTSAPITEDKDIEVTIKYEGASTGIDYHLAAVVTSGDRALYYGQLVNLDPDADTSGNVTFVIPEYKTGNEVYVFVEGRNNNDDKNTDYASVPICIAGIDRKIEPLDVDVADNPPVLKAIDFDSKALTLAEGSAMQLSVVFTPKGMQEEIIWSSQNPYIASVDSSGLVTALEPGETIITAITKDSGKKDTCTITVTERPQGPALILTPMSMTISKGIKEKITASFSGIDEQPLRWTSGNENIATVDENGTVTAIAEGECEITATAKTADGPYSEKCKVKVVTATQIHSSGGGSGGCNTGIPGIVTLLTLTSLILIRSRNGK